MRLTMVTRMTVVPSTIITPIAIVAILTARIPPPPIAPPPVVPPAIVASFPPGSPRFMPAVMADTLPEHTPAGSVPPGPIASARVALGPVQAAEPIHVTPTPEQAGQRIDRLLAEAIGAMSRSRVKALIEEGALSRPEDTARGVGAIVVTEPAEPARAGVTYTLLVPPPIAAAPLPEAIPLILFEDRDLIVLDKPAGLVVHPAPGNWDGPW